MAEQPADGIVPVLADGQQVGPVLTGQGELSPDEGMRPPAEQDGDQLGGRAENPAERLGAVELLAKARARVALCRHERLRARDPKVELEPAPPVVLGDGREQRESSIELDQALDAGTAPQRGQPGTQPPDRRPVVKSRLGRVMSQQVRHCLAGVGAAARQRGDDAPVQPPPFSPQQRAVGGILHQRVLAGIAHVGRRAAGEQEAGADQPVQCLPDHPLGQFRHCEQQVFGEFPPDRGADLRHLPRCRNAVETRHQQRLQAGRHDRRRPRAVGRRRPVQHRLGEFLGEQRHAVGLPGDPLQQRGRQRTGAGDLRREFCRLLPVEPAQGDQAGAGMTDPGRHEFRAIGDNEQNRQPRQPVDQPVEQFQRAGVGPVRVLEHHQRGPLARQRIEVPAEGRECLFLPLLRAEVGIGIEPAGRHRQQRGKPRDILRCQAGRREHQLEFAQPLLGRVGTSEAGVPLPARDHRMQRRVLVQGRAEVSQVGMRLGGQGLLQRRQQPRLADAWLAGQQDKPTLAGLRPPPCMEQQRKLQVASDQRHDRLREQGFGAAGKFGRPEHLPDAGRQFAIGEQAVREASRIGRRGNLARRGERREPHRLAGRLAKHLAGRIGDDKPARDTDGYGDAGRQVRIARADLVGQRQRGMDRPLGGVLLRHRIAEIGQHLALAALRHGPAVTGDDGAGGAAIGFDDALQFFRIVRQRAGQLGGERRDKAPLGDAGDILRRFDGGRRIRHFLRGDPAHLRRELVAGTRDGEDQGRALGIKLDLPAQPHDQHIDAALESLGFAAGQDLPEKVARQHPSRPLHEARQQDKLASRERDVAAVLIEQAVAGQIQAVARELQNWLGCGRVDIGHRTQRLGDPRQQGGFVGRVEPLDFALLPAASCREEHDLSDRALQHLDQTVAVAPQPVRGDHRQADAFRADPLHRRCALGEFHTVAGRAQHARETRTQCQVTSDNQNSAAHAPSGSPATQSNKLRQRYFIIVFICRVRINIRHAGAAIFRFCRNGPDIQFPAAIRAFGLLNCLVTSGPAACAADHKPGIGTVGRFAHDRSRSRRRRRRAFRAGLPRDGQIAVTMIVCGRWRLAGRWTARRTRSAREVRAGRNQPAAATVLQRRPDIQGGKQGQAGDSERGHGGVPLHLRSAPPGADRGVDHRRWRSCDRRCSRLHARSGTDRNVPVAAANGTERDGIREHERSQLEPRSAKHLATPLRCGDRAFAGGKLRALHDDLRSVSLARNLPVRGNCPIARR